MKLLSVLFLPLLLAGQKIETVTVVAQAIARTPRLPAEIRPFQRTAIQARINGYVEAVLADRGSLVNEGQLLVKLSAPELAAQIAEASAKVRSIEAQKAEAEGKLQAARATHQHLKAASATPGVVATHEVLLAEAAVKTAEGVLTALDAAAEAARAAIAPIEEMRTFLEIKAPFPGIITERRVHSGALVGPSSEALLVIEQQDRLRVEVAVPEADVAGIARGARVTFRVPAHPGTSFTGTVARVPNSIDAATRTMPVELDASNPGRQLAPGMFAEVDWPVRRRGSSLFVPATAVVTTTEQSFVVRVNGGRAEWVDVAKGAKDGDLVEVFGALRAGDTIVKRATDEIRNGSMIGS